MPDPTAAPRKGLTIVAGLAPCLARLADAPAAAAGSPFQGEAFVSAFWRTAAGAVPLLLVAGTASDEPPALLPLTLRRRGPFGVAEGVGETHANTLAWRGNAAPVLDAADIAGAAAAAGLRVDALVLRRFGDAAGLGAGFATVPAPEERFAIDLAGGFDAVLERGNAKRKRKKFRSQERHFASRGGYRFRLIPPDERAGALAVFAAHKAARFRALGLPDPFAEPGIAAFLATLYASESSPARLYAVEAGGAVKALMGGLVENGTFWGMFSSFAEDGDAEASPGELLLWHLVETLCAEGLARLDLGPGEERYKRSWCDLQIAQVDGFAALTRRGAVFLALARARTKAEALAKGDPRLRALAQRGRRLWQTLRRRGQAASDPA